MTTPPPTPGSLADLLEKKQVLEGSVQSLSHLRDQLALALMTMEQNTDRITTWLKTNREPIIITRHRLTRALAQPAASGQRTRAIEELLADKVHPDLLGFLLSDGSLIAQAEAAFGVQHALVAQMRARATGLPASLIEPLPVFDIPEDVAKNIAQMQQSLTGGPLPPSAPEAQKPKGGVLSGWFKNQAQRETENAEAAYNGILTHWRQIQRDLIGLQSDRHYYIDSFMDWVGENLSPKTPDQNFAALMTQYRHPSYVIARAQEDYDDALKIRTQALLDDANVYSRAARLLDEQDIPAFIKEMPALFPHPDQPAAAEMRRLLLADFRVTSFADIALDHVQAADHRLQLLEAARRHEGSLTLHGETDLHKVIDRIQRAVMQQGDKALPVAALTLALRDASAQGIASGTIAMDYLVRNAAFSAFTNHFGKDDDTYTVALNALLAGIKSSYDPACVQHFVALRRAALNADSTQLAAAMTAIATPDMAAKVRALCALTMMRGDSGNLAFIMRSSAKGDAATLQDLLTQGISLGLISEIVWHGDKYNQNRDSDALRTTASLLKTLLGDAMIAQADPATIALLLAGARLEKNDAARNAWRDRLQGNTGILAAVASHGGIDTARKLEIIAALLSPYKDSITTTAILERTADSLTAADPAATLLRDVARSITGDVIRIDDDRYLINAHHIANIWYDSTEKHAGSVFFTLGDKTQTLAAQIDQQRAMDLLDILHLRHGFMRENMGLFNPDSADGFEYSPAGTRIIWDMHVAPLGITPTQQAQLRARPDMLHAATEDASISISMQPRNVLALLPMQAAGKWLMIDRNGSHQTINTLALPANMKPLIRMGSAYINPDRASLLALDASTRSISLRVENPIFTQLVDAMPRHGLERFSSDGQYIKVQAATQAEWEACLAAINDNPAQLSPGGDLGHLRFNLETLGCITTYADNRSAGLQYSHHDKGGVSGRIEVDAELLSELMTGLKKSASSHAGAIVINADTALSSLIVHAETTHNVFYHAGHGALMILTEHSNLRPAMQTAAATRVLKDLSQQDGWDILDNRSQTPDLARLDHATVLYWDDEGSANALLGNRAISLGMTRSDFTRFIAARNTGVPASAAKSIAPTNLPMPLPPQSEYDLLKRLTTPRESGSIKHSKQEFAAQAQLKEMLQQNKSAQKDKKKSAKKRKPPGFSF